MSAMKRWMEWAAVLGFAVVFTGCGGGDDPKTVAKQTETDQNAATQMTGDVPDSVPSEQFGNDPVSLSDEAGVADKFSDDGIVQAGGLEETTVSGIQTVAGEEGVFDGATLDGNLVFDEDDGEADADAPEEKIVPPKKGSAEFYISEITKLRLQPFPKTNDPKQQQAVLKNRQLKIIELAENAIKLTHADKKQQRVFDVAINKLLGARLQLALSGDSDSIDSIYEHAASLYERDPKSAAAAEGTHTLVNLAYSKTNSAVFAGTITKDPRWLKEFARQAEIFAVKFPKEERRSVPLLFTAAENCEIYGLFSEAINCHTVLAKSFPKHQAREASIAVVRRLRMNGKQIKLFGTTLDGNRLSLKQFAGKTTIVFFWTTEAQPAVDQVPEVLAALKKYGNKRLGVIGVCLDSKQETVDEFLVKQEMPWSNIFNPDEKKRGWNNPIVKFYGVRRVPALWVIDPSGRVVTTTLTAGQLDEALGTVLKQRTAERPGRRTN